MTDIYSNGEAKRLFGFIAAGGTVGASDRSGDNCTSGPVSWSQKLIAGVGIISVLGGRVYCQAVGVV